jgi:hypothetical protein
MQETPTTNSYLQKDGAIVFTKHKDLDNIKAQLERLQRILEQVEKENPPAE